ncbi:MAG: hypothetical protein IJQ02_07235 [Oscillospiraceae bacterium]|nr:hypothetical protein [Oscillospiraceae bacterium]
MMKSRKKKIVLFLLTALVFSLAACGSKETAISVSGENVTVDDLALRPGGEAGILYENDGLKLMIPLEYDELLLKEIPQDDQNGILFSVTEKASADAAEASGEEYDGAGWLFSIGRISEEELKEQLCGDMSGREVIAGDASGNYYLLYHPTDVRYFREDNEAMERDRELWSNLTSWAYSRVPESFLAENSSLIPESRDNSNLGICLAQIAYQPGCDYTVSTTEYGPIAPEAGFDALPYAERLIKGVRYEYLDGEEAPDGEYVVLSFPDGRRFDFFLAEGGENIVREVWGEQYETLYRAVFDDGSTLASTVMQEWYDALAANRTMSDLGYTADAFVGNWADKIGGRCSIEISRKEGSEDYSIYIHWGSSAFETSVWNMTAHPAGSNVLRYEDCRHAILTYDQNGNETETLQYENGSGAFELTSTNELLWHDEYDHAADDMPFISEAP